MKSRNKVLPCIKSKSFYNENFQKKDIRLDDDVSIIQDFSAGSNATTVLCEKNNKLFFRKYVYGLDSKKLYNQVNWILNHNQNIKLTSIENIKYSDNYCLYDMPYNIEAISCYKYIQTISVYNAWSIIRTVIEDISANLHTLNIRDSNKENIDKYINQKVLENLKKIYNCKYFKLC